MPGERPDSSKIFLHTKCQGNAKHTLKLRSWGILCIEISFCLGERRFLPAPGGRELTIEGALAHGGGTRKLKLAPDSDETCCNAALKRELCRKGAGAEFQRLSPHSVSEV